MVTGDDLHWGLWTRLEAVVNLLSFQCTFKSEMPGGPHLAQKQAMLLWPLDMSVHLESSAFIFAGAVSTGKEGRKWACGICIC